jgi:uncharacterized membrane protein YhaH (DUF805 family)/cold shock CspA family protein
MDGEVIYFDPERGVGFVAGRDGNRYVFDRADIVGAGRLPKGARVRFEADADRARAVEQLAQRGTRVLDRPAGVPPTDAAGSVPSISGTGIGAVDAEPPDAGEELGLFGYFLRCLTQNYANFEGRARRKEFWSFALILIAATVPIALAGLTLDFAAGNLQQIASDADFEAGGAPWITFAMIGVLVLVMIVPLFAVTVRRIHDIGLSGWFLLMNFIPSVGSFIILVFTLIPSQRHPNRWGPVPAGIVV